MALFVGVQKFCFINNAGTFEYDVRYAADYEVQNINFYYDTADQWGRVSGEKTDLVTCEDKASILEKANNQIINLTQNVLISGCKNENQPKFDENFTSTRIRCKGKRNSS